MSDIVDTRLANAFFADARLSEELVAKGKRWHSSTLWTAISRQAQTDRRMRGGVWVGGKAVLTNSIISFVPNIVNQMMHAAPEDLKTSISLENISNVSVHRSLITDIIEIQTNVGIFKIRRFKAKAFAAAIDATRIATRDALNTSS